MKLVSIIYVERDLGNFNLAEKKIRKARSAKWQDLSLFWLVLDLYGQSQSTDSKHSRFY